MLITESFASIDKKGGSRLLWTLLLLLRCCESIHLEAVLVPQYRHRGSNASLLCKYELEPNEELFSLKWYKEDTEFYRHTPPDLLNQPPPMTTYGDPPQFNRKTFPTQKHMHQQNEGGLVQTWPVPGIRIDEENSRPQHVILKRVTFKSTGTYRCEVTAKVKQRNGYGIQGFVMKESINKMVVVEMPQSKPVITGGHQELPGAPKMKYKPGDVLNLTCTSAPSNPPAQLEWRLNDKKVNPSYIPHEREHLINMKRGLYSSTIGLLMTLRDEHFRDGELRIKCKGTIAAEFWKRDVENVYSTERDTFVYVLEMKETQWPDSACSSRVNLWVMFVIIVILPNIF